MFIMHARFYTVCFFVSSLFAVSTVLTHAQMPGNGKENLAVDEENSKKQKLALELNRLRQIQNRNVELLEEKVRNRAMSQNTDLKDVSALRNSIRSAVRIINIHNYSLMSTSGFNNLANQLILSLPTYSSFNFATYETAEAKNMQGRLTLRKSAFEKLNRQYVREALELETALCQFHPYSCGSKLQ